MVRLLLGYLKMNKNRNCARSYDPSQGRGEEFFSFFFFGVGRHAISPRQKWWQTVLEIKVSCSQWKAQHGLVRGPDFFFLGLGRGGGGFFILFYSLFSLVPIMFHMCSLFIIPFNCIYHFIFSLLISTLNLKTLIKIRNLTWTMASNWM
jgi:hypothetical protein